MLAAIGVHTKKMGTLSCRSVLWLLDLVIGGSVGWYMRGLSEQDVRASTEFIFTDNLADRQVPILSAQGSWRGGDLANKINTVQIVCVAPERL